MNIQVGFAIFSEERRKFLCKYPDTGGPMSAPGYPYESKCLNDGFWLATKEPNEFLATFQKEYPTYKVIPVWVGVSQI